MRRSAGWSLDQLAERSHLSASTISRIETGKRNISLDLPVALARALDTDVNALIEVHDDDDDVVIRPQQATSWPHATTWTLSRPASPRTAIKVHLEPTDQPPEPRVHPGHDWLFMLTGTVVLTLGARRIRVEAGQAAEFSTMTPHAFEAVDGPAEMVMIFDRDGQRSHLHRDDDS